MLAIEQRFHRFLMKFEDKRIRTNSVALFRFTPPVISSAGMDRQRPWRNELACLSGIVAVKLRWELNFPSTSLNNLFETSLDNESKKKKRERNNCPANVNQSSFNFLSGV